MEIYLAMVGTTFDMKMCEGNPEISPPPGWPPKLAKTEIQAIHGLKALKLAKTIY